jgi:ribosomal-protein-alanine N-acetyltransferase
MGAVSHEEGSREQPIDSATLLLRAMRPADVPAVAAIEDASFSAGWPRTEFERELARNPVARYVVLERARQEANGAPRALVGFGGIWLLLDEAHVVTVAVAPAYRRRGYGRLLVHGLVGLARSLGMHVGTLECRVSNTAARQLYREYGFYEVGSRRRYYADNGEDAVIMTTEELSSPAYLERYERLGRKLESCLPGARLELSGPCD